MFSTLGKEEKSNFLSKIYDRFIPGYTGYCPTLKFKYGRGYGISTKDILKESHTEKIVQDVQKEEYGSQDHKTPIHEPIAINKEQFEEYDDNKDKAPKYIMGYAGFIPTFDSRYGKSHSRAVDDCIHEYGTNKYRRLQMAQGEIDRVLSAQSAPCITSVISDDELKDYDVDSKDRAPKYIMGYTGFIPTLNSRYGKSHSRAVDDCIYEYGTNRHQLAEEEIDRVLSAPPCMTSTRSEDEVKRPLNEYVEHKVSPEYPPTAGYTGHMPRVLQDFEKPHDTVTTW